MAAMLATAAISTATRVMAAFRLSPPKTCQSGHDNLADIQTHGISASGLGSGDTAMAALRFRFAPPAGNHGAGGNLALTINADHSVWAGHR